MDLPTEVWFRILDNVDSYVDICRLSCSSKSLNEICNENVNVWKRFLNSLFPLISYRMMNSNEIKESSVWRQKFKNR